MPPAARARRLSVFILCLIAWAGFLAVVVVPSARTPSTNGFVAYYTESRVLLENPRQVGRVYDDAWFHTQTVRFFAPHVFDVVHAQSPAMSLILAPVAWLPPAPARAIWIALSVALWLAGLAVLVRALPLGQSRAEAVLALSAAGTLYSPLIDGLARGQVYTLLFFLLCLALRILLRPPGERRWTAGIPLGIMIFIKAVSPWLWLALWAARQKRVLAVAAATLLAAALLTWPVLGSDAWRTALHDGLWLRANPYIHLTAYQTVVSFTGHLFVRTPGANPAPIADRPIVAALLALAILTGALVRSARLQRLDAADLEGRALSMALFVSLMECFSPMAEAYHFVLAVPAIVIAFWWTTRAPERRRRRWSLLGWVLLLNVPQLWYGWPPLSRGWLALLAYPRLYGAFGLWFWIGRALESEGRDPARAAEAK
ncbi:MAG TPA: glycosyltransferase family 87 protein [Polyangia bacterium]|nr:glycosyltransferase family 87 protein [Polyangia bacterium]